MKSLFIDEMNWVDIEYLIKTGYRNIVIGISTIEQHGPHLPLKTDVLMTDIIITKIAVKLGKTLIGPAIKLGCSGNHLSFPGTIALGKMTLQSIVWDYIFSLFKHGFENIIFIPSNERNYFSPDEFLVKFREKHENLKIIVFGEFDKIKEKHFYIAGREKISENEAGIHAGEIETSMMLNVFPGLVKTNRLAAGYLSKGKNNIDNNDIKVLSENGIIGDSTKSNSRRGELYINSSVDIIVDYILKQMK